MRWESKSPENRSRSFHVMLVAVLFVTAVGFAFYIGSAQSQLGTFTLQLDDGWIHQTFARNLAQGRLFTYSDDQLSTGCTSPAWAVLLSVGHLIGVSPVTWAFAWGFIFHVLISIVTYFLSLSYFHNERLALVTAVFTAMEWHLTWIALSGMETSMFVFTTVLFLLLLHTNPERSWLLGLVGGLMFLVRPEGILLVFIAILWIIRLNRANPRHILGNIVTMGLVFVLVVGPDLIFNTVVSGKPFVGTFYAKYVQWVDPWSISKALQYFGILGHYFLLEGSLTLLFPLALAAFWLARRERMTQLIPLLLWLSGLPIAYSVILPYAYNRGRYVMSLIPLIILLGTWVAFWIIQSRFYRRLGYSIVAMAGLMIVVFWIRCAQAYVLDVRALVSQHMSVVDWIKDNTQPDSIIATQDIGVLGYFSERRLIDLAGLTEPEMVPIMHQPDEMGKYILEKGGDYVVVFPSYYSELIEDQKLELVFVSNRFNYDELGSDPLAVFRIPDTSDSLP